MGWIILGGICFFALVFSFASNIYDGVSGKSGKKNELSNIEKTIFYSKTIENATGRKVDGTEKAFIYKCVEDKNKRK